MTQGVAATATVLEALDRTRTRDAINWRVHVQIPYP